LALSVSGTSSHTIKAGLVMSPLNQAAGSRLVSAIKRLAGGLPVSANTVGGRLAVTFGYSSLQQLLQPAATLAGDPTFKDAASQLPAGAKPALYLDFGPIAMLASLSRNTSASTLRALHQIKYLVAGGTHTHFRLVLATR
jgi:hypothetical protein